jgi:Nuclease-related domain
MWIFIAIIPLIIFIALYREIGERKLLATVTTRKRGTRTERDLVLKLLKYGIPAPTIFHDLYVKKHNGHFSQIDLVVATKAGIIVFEVKEYSGWIFGTGHHSHWTQVLAYGKRKYRFYNPILQNSKHISDLKKQLKQFENVPFYSIVVFYGSCVLKDISFVPNGTFLIQSESVLAVIQGLMTNNEPARYTNKNEIVRLLKEAVKNGEDKATRIQHIQNIRKMLDRDSIFD